jgi:predicted nucleic acid-binding protein
MRYVLDASVALKWVRDEEDSGRALFLRVEMEQGLHEYVAPDIFPVEISHVLTKFYRQNVLTADEAEAHLGSILSTLPQLVPSIDLLPAAFAIAQKTRTSFYDALYLALGESENAPVITADQKMAKLPYNVIELSKLGA